MTYNVFGEALDLTQLNSAEVYRKLGSCGSGKDFYIQYWIMFTSKLC